MNEFETPIYEILQYRDKMVMIIGDTEIVQTKDEVMIQARDRARLRCPRPSAQNAGTAACSAAEWNMGD